MTTTYADSKGKRKRNKLSDIRSFEVGAVSRAANAWPMLVCKEYREMDLEKLLQAQKLIGNLVEVAKAGNLTPEASAKAQEQTLEIANMFLVEAPKQFSADDLQPLKTLGESLTAYIEESSITDLMAQDQLDNARNVVSQAVESLGNVLAIAKPTETAGTTEPQQASESAAETAGTAEKPAEQATATDEAAEATSTEAQAETQASTAEQAASDETAQASTETPAQADAASAAGSTAGSESQLTTKELVESVAKTAVTAAVEAAKATSKEVVTEVLKGLNITSHGLLLPSHTPTDESAGKPKTSDEDNFDWSTESFEAKLEDLDLDKIPTV